mmetsp:Transcript_67752/g.107348  ORF Transcript_67752/g.107348 Transcript_67752/m.107348 type:complete len:205 (-) Transcript_67752:915-1529(-)
MPDFKPDMSVISSCFSNIPVLAVSYRSKILMRSGFFVVVLCSLVSVEPIHAGLRQLPPAKTASFPSCSSIRMSWLYFAFLSDRQGAPVLIWPQHNPTDMSAMVVSSVSPDRWEHITPQPFVLHNFTASIASVSDPIWFTFKRRALQALVSRALFTFVTFVTVRSSPTTCVATPMFAVKPVHAAQSSWSKGSSMVTIGKSLQRPA